MQSSRQRAALLLACALILVWGINFSVLKAVLTALTPNDFLFIRYLICNTPSAYAVICVASTG